jgi:hypothetical protein
LSAADEHRILGMPGNGQRAEPMVTNLSGNKRALTILDAAYLAFAARHGKTTTVCRPSDIDDVIVDSDFAAGLEQCWW